MSDLIERLRKEQGRLQRVYDSGHESVKRQRAIKYRLKMMHEAAEEIERLQARVDELESAIRGYVKATTGQESAIVTFPMALEGEVK